MGVEMITCSTCHTPNSEGVTHCMLCASPLILADIAASILADAETKIERAIDADLQRTLFTDPSGTNTYPGPSDVSFASVGAAIDVAQETVVDCTICDGNPPVEGCATFERVPVLTCADVRAATDVINTEPLDWDEPVTDWLAGDVLPHYIGWYDVQMRSRFNDDHAAEGITRFWFAGRDWYTGPRAVEIEAPCVPRGNIFHWRGMVKP